VVELAKPVAEATVQLQGDTPKLSSVLPMFQSLLRHAQAWKALVPAALSLSKGKLLCRSLPASLDLVNFF
jgi:hypothetical protein